MDLMSRHLDVDGSSVHYRVGGEGQPVVMVHGWLESSWCWSKIIERLMPQYRVYAIDLVGFGQSTPPEDATPFDIFSNARVVETLLRERIGEPVHLVGHSMGGMIAVLLATDFPEMIRSMTLASSPIDGPNAVARVLQLVGLPLIRDSTYRLLRSRGVTRLLSNFFVYQTPVPDQMIEDAQKVSHAAVFGAARSIMENNLEPILRKVRCPTLVIHGDKDRVIDLNQGALAADRIRDAHFQIFRSCGHCPNIEEPWKVSEALLRFFREVSGTGPQLMGVTF